MDLFDILNDLTVNKKEPDFEDEAFANLYKGSKFMINRFVSMVDVFLPYVNEINKYPDIPDEIHYKYYKNILPQRKIYFNYVKGTKDLTSEEKKYIAHYFNVGKKEAEIYLHLLNEDEIQEILNVYKLGKKMIPVG